MPLGRTSDIKQEGFDNLAAGQVERRSVTTAAPSEASGRGAKRRVIPQPAPFSKKFLGVLVPRMSLLVQYANSVGGGNYERGNRLETRRNH
jgi:hypothetical protein